MDFMTRGGAAHPVWWSEPVQWHVLLGGGIDGEVRLCASHERSRQMERRQAGTDEMHLA